MEQILPNYHDPLFSVVLLVFIGLIIAIATYAWSAYKTKQDQQTLISFLDKFESKECVIDKNSTPYNSSMLTPLSLLAKAFNKNGEYHKAISIYLYLIDSIPEEITKYEIMGYLGQTYIQAGFLERAKSIYLAILAKKPRNTKALYALGIVYESMHAYNKAKETLQPLKLLGEDTKSLEYFWSFLEIYSDKSIDKDSKIEKFLNILTEEPRAYRYVFNQILILDKSKAWEIFEAEKSNQIIDILWRAPDAWLSEDIISLHPFLQALYYANGYLPNQPQNKSGFFTIDLLIHARKSGFDGGDLNFEYLCDKCKRSFPIAFQRCPNCMSIYSMKVEGQIGKFSSQTNHSLL